MPGLQPEDTPPTDHARTAREVVFLEDPNLLDHDPDAFADRVFRVTTLLRELNGEDVGE